MIIVLCTLRHQLPRSTLPILYERLRSEEHCAAFCNHNKVRLWPKLLHDSSWPALSHVKEYCVNILRESDRHRIPPVFVDTDTKTQRKSVSHIFIVEGAAALQDSIYLDASLKKKLQVCGSVLSVSLTHSLHHSL